MKEAYQEVTKVPLLLPPNQEQKSRKRQIAKRKQTSFTNPDGLKS
jgi:hypothetical protein